MNANRTAAAFLRRFTQPQAPSPQERCGLCSAPLTEGHAHLFEIAARRPVCACGACAILFADGAGGRFRRIPDRVEELTGFRMTDMQWAALGLPVNLAFFLHNSAAGRVTAVYPSPAGATEALVPLPAWQDIEDENPTLAGLEPDVEALLIHRIGPARDVFRVGLDKCFELAGLIRLHWRGFSGGTAVWDEIARFFAGLRQRSASRRSGATGGLSASASAVDLPTLADKPPVAPAGSGSAGGTLHA